MKGSHVSSARHGYDEQMNEPSYQDADVAHLAAALSRWGLGTPARLFLEAGHPVTFLGGQLLWLAQPALSLFFPWQRIRQAAQLLEEPEKVAGLLAHLEAAEGSNP